LVAHGIVNIAHVISAIITSDNMAGAANTFFVLPYVDPAGINNVSAYIDRTNITLGCGNYSRTDCTWTYATLRYTCTDR
jgi:hypothetical protein